MLSTVVGVLYILTHLIFIITLGSRYYYCPHFKSKENEKRGEIKLLLKFTQLQSP